MRSDAVGAGRRGLEPAGAAAQRLVLLDLGLARPRRSRTLTVTATALSSARGRRVNHAVLNARDARPANASGAITVQRIRILGGGVTG